MCCRARALFCCRVSFRGAELEKSIAAVRGGDEASALRRLADLLKGVRAEFKVARRLGESAVEAAAKCQVRHFFYGTACRVVVHFVVLLRRPLAWFALEVIF